MSNPKTYLGDSVYAAHDGFHVVLTTENGLGPSNTIYLESNVTDALLRFIERVYGVKIEAKRNEGERKEA